MSTTAPARLPSDDLLALVQRLQSDDESVLEDVLRYLGPRVEGLLKVRYPCLRAEDREEFLIEALYRLWLARFHFDPAKGSLQGWYYSIAENLLKDRYKRKRCQEHVCDPSELADNEHQGPRRLNADDDLEAAPSSETRVLNEILAQLTDLERRIVLAHASTGGEGQWAAELSEELAADLGMDIRPGTIRVKRIRIHDKIRKRMQGRD